ncbi:MAG: c-type cytochrome [Nannocystales bacterium]
MKSRPSAYSLSLLLLIGAGCEAVDLPDPIEDPGTGAVQRAGFAPPIMGGTLLVTHDGGHAVVSDPARDSIHIVDLNAWQETGTIDLEAGALPFRATEDNDGRVHVTLRGPGTLLTLDPESARVTKTTSVCPNPRGVAFDETNQALHVACAGGMVVTLPESGAEPTRRFVASDLRDVLVSEGRLFVTRFRAAELIELEDDGAWSLFGAPVSIINQGTTREPTTAWRTLLRPGGGWLMLHQLASTRVIPGFEEPDAHDNFEESGYGGLDPCSAVVNTTLSATREDGVVHNAGVFAGLALSVDVALSPDGKRVAIASPTQQDLTTEDRISVFEVRLDSTSTWGDRQCEIPTPLDVDDDIVAVAFQPDDALLAQARDKPILYRFQGAQTEQLELAGADADDTGFELFHNNAGQGVSCASCHPEGGEDGRTWLFDAGPRRTQPLNVGLEGTAPFHWKGDMEDIHMIARQVRQGAMGGIEQTEERQAALRDWMFSLRPPNPLRSQSDASAAKGQQLFASLGCASCHAGPSFTSAASSDLGHGPLQTPALRGVALRAPYMHDARALTLEEAVLDMASTTASGTELDGEQVASIVAYLESL